MNGRDLVWARGGGWQGPYVHGYESNLMLNVFVVTQWYRKAAEQDEAAAQCNLRVAYAAGESVGQEDVQGVKWFRMAAEQGYGSRRYARTRGPATR